MPGRERAAWPAFSSIIPKPPNRRGCWPSSWSFNIKADILQGGGQTVSEKIYSIPADVARRAWIDEKKYQAMYARSVNDPDGFWAEQAREFVTWFKPWTKVSDWSFDAKNLHIKWFEGAKLNVSYNCLDRHLEK